MRKAVDRTRPVAEEDIRNGDDQLQLFLTSRYEPFSRLLRPESDVFYRSNVGFSIWKSFHKGARLLRFRAFGPQGISRRLYYRKRILSLCALSDTMVIC